jgi:EAL domain-containing protein (putative c-di-GMP-specific phosphodiesterase class I)
MVKKKEESKGAKPMTTPDGREQQLINLAINLAEKQLREGTASPSVINHYLKMGTTRERLEREILEKQSKLIEAKERSIAEGKNNEQLAKAAIEAMKNYNSGSN